MTNQPTVTEYPQIRTMFSDALKAMAEGETEAEKQIVYVLNEARAALPCPSFVARMSRAHGSFALYAVRRSKPVFIVGARKGSVMGDHVPASRRRKGSAEPTKPPAERFTVFLTPESADGDGHLADGQPSLLNCLAGAIQDAYLDIMQAAAEAGTLPGPPRQLPY
jgi:hypothetical protein